VKPLELGSAGCGLRTADCGSESENKRIANPTRQIAATTSAAIQTLRGRGVRVRLPASAIARAAASGPGTLDAGPGTLDARSSMLKAM